VFVSVRIYYLCHLHVRLFIADKTSQQIFSTGRCRRPLVFTAHVAYMTRGRC